MKLMDARTRVSFKNILYLTDFSPTAEGAAPIVLALARRYGAKVFAVHVRAPQVYGMAPPESWPALEEAAAEQAKDQANHLDKLFNGIAHDALIEEGDVWSAASAVIERNDIDLIVLGTHARKGVSKMLLGSVAETIFRLAPCPVLTVGPRAHMDNAHAADLGRILYATSFSDSSVAAAAYAISLAQENQAHLDLLHVIEIPRTGELVDSAQLKPGSEHRLHDLVPPDADLWCEPNVLVEVGDPAQEILSVAQGRRSDLIVLGVKKAESTTLGAATHLPWAVAHKVICGAECPVLTVRG